MQQHDIYQTEPTKIVLNLVLVNMLYRQIVATLLTMLISCGVDCFTVPNVDLNDLLKESISSSSFILFRQHGPRKKE